jgi:hypothetical protein
MTVLRLSGWCIDRSKISVVLKHIRYLVSLEELKEVLALSLIAESGKPKPEQKASQFLFTEKLIP